MTRIYDRLINGLATGAGLLIAAVCLLIAWDVIARNTGLPPPASTVALTEYALLYFTMAAAPWLVRQRGHIVVEILYQHYPPIVRRWMDRAILGFCTLVCVGITILAVLLMFEAMRLGEIDVRSMDTPRWMLFAPLVVGFSLMATEFGRLLWRGEPVGATVTERGDAL